jgi:hypothetical protein
MGLIVPSKIERKLKEEAERKGASEEELVLKILSKALDEPLDPDELVEVHLKLLEKYMNEAEDFLKKGDYVQASERAWGAAAQAVKALAAKDEREIRSHRELQEYAASIIEKDAELRKGWSAAGELHRNFYEAWLPPKLVRGYIEDVKEFLSRIKRLQR